MILADSCVWIEFLSSRGFPGLDEMIVTGEVAICGTVIAEVLSGVKKDAEADRLEKRLGSLPYLAESFGNPSCVHEWGDGAREALEVAREQVARLIGANSEEIIFTGSGTESNNFAVKGLALAQQNKGRHVVVSAIEHFSVLNSARTLEKEGFELAFRMGADFLNIGMFDFQVAQDAAMVKQILSGGLERERPWRA